jgi:hypothetical protein
MTVHPFQHLPPPPSVKSFAELAVVLRRIWDALYQLRKGKIECVAELTLTPNSGTTVFNFNGISVQSVIVFDPKTANAALEKANGTLYVTTANRGSNQWTITHANNAQSDRQFQIAVIG